MIKSSMLKITDKEGLKEKGDPGEEEGRGSRGRGEEIKLFIVGFLSQNKT